MRHVDVNANTPGVIAFAVRPASDVNMTISESSLRASGSGVSGAGLQQAEDGTIDIRDSSLEVGTTGGTALEQNGVGTITVTDSTIRAPTFGLSTITGTVHVANSLVSSAQAPGGTQTCINSYKADYTTPTAGNCT
jgi:hypothetical protein